MIALVAAPVLALAAALWLAQLVRGPASHDRLLCASAARTTGCLIIACIGVAARDTLWIDVAIAGALFEALLVLAGVKALQRRSFQPALAPLGEG